MADEPDVRADYLPQLDLGDLRLTARPFGVTVSRNGEHVTLDATEVDEVAMFLTSLCRGSVVTSARPQATSIRTFRAVYPPHSGAAPERVAAALFGPDNARSEGRS